MPTLWSGPESGYPVACAIASCQGILIALLTALLQPKSPISQVTVLNPEVPKEHVGDKGIELDLLVHLDDGTQVNVEMQAKGKAAFRNRAMYYWARTYANQLRKGDAYAKLKPVVIIILAGYRQLATNRLHSIFHVLEVHDHVRFEDAFALHLVELPRIDDPDAEAGAMPAVRRWAKFLGAHTDEERSEVAKEDPMVNEAQTILEELSSDEAVRRLAEQREIALKFWEMELELVREQSEAKGEARGEARGQARGQAESILKVLAARGIELTTESRARLLACRDRSVLDEMLRRALALQPGEDLFESQPDEPLNGKG
jgi:predicted transposase/invertase (TIGR01784 family)